MKILQLRMELKKRGQLTRGSLAALRKRLVDAVTTEGESATSHTPDATDAQKPGEMTHETSGVADTSKVDIAGTKSSDVHTSL